MDNNELKDALLNKRPVIYKNRENIDLEFQCVSAIRYTEKNGGVEVSAELTDLNGKSVTICDPKRIRYKEGLNND